MGEPAWKPNQNMGQNKKQSEDPFTFGGFTPDMRRTLIRCHDENKTDAETAKVLGISVALVSKESWFWGLEFRKEESPLKGRVGLRGWTASDKQLLVDLVARGLSGTEIAAAMEKPRSTVFWYARSLGVHVKGRPCKKK